MRALDDRRGTDSVFQEGRAADGDLTADGKNAVQAEKRNRNLPAERKRAQRERSGNKMAIVTAKVTNTHMSFDFVTTDKIQIKIL